MTDKLSAAEWNLIYALPVDGNTYNVEGVAFRAVHYPATKIRVECVIAETRIGTVRRRLVNGRWQAVEQVANLFR